MANVDVIRAITEAFCENRTDQAVLARSFAPDFRFWSNGAPGDLSSYAAAMAEYTATYDRFSIPAWDELFEAGDKVVVAYRLDGKRKDGASDAVYVMAVWQLKDGKVVSLRQVVARL